MQVISNHVFTAAGIAIPTIAMTTGIFEKPSVVMAITLMTGMKKLGFSEKETAELLGVGTLGAAISAMFGTNKTILLIQAVKVTLSTGVILGADFYGRNIARKFGCNPELIKIGTRLGTFASSLLGITGMISPATSAVSLIGGAIAGVTAGLFSL